jgi:putative ABC transport system permease protein
MKDKPTPPRLAWWLFQKFIPLNERKYLQEAMLEVFEELLTTKNKGAAWLWFWSQLLRSLPALLANSLYWSVQMIKNYMRITYRNLKKNKFYSFINITGLAIGIACCLIIFLWIQNELGYDRFHKNAGELYRIFQESPQGGKVFRFTSTPSGLGPLLKEQYPEILDSARHTPTRWDIGREEIHFRERVALVDDSFLKMFSFPLLEGTPQAALEDPYSIVISEEMREKYFSGEDPLGQTLRVGESLDLNVTGVLQDIPNDSHMHFDCLVPFKILGEFDYNMNDWGSNNYWTYIQLTENASSQEVETKISGIIQEHVPESSAILHLQPVVRIHLYALGGGGLISYIYIFAGMAVFILLIACINYMNLSTARSANRAREVGIRQVVGANRIQLIKQFMGESVFYAFIALIIGLVILQLLLPIFSQLAGKPLSLNYSARMILVLIGLTLFTGLLAGIYPAFVLSSFQAISALKGALKSRGGRAFFRRILVVTQFSLSIFLIIGTLFVFRQINFMMNRELGYNKENILCVPMRGQLARNYPAFKTRLQENPSIISMARANTTPDIKQSSIADYDITWDGREEGDNFPGINVMGVDADYLKTLNMEMAEGRFFSEQIQTDSTDSWVINEAAAAAMGLESPLGTGVYWADYKGKIIGVIKDFHFSSLREEIEPLLMRMNLWMDNILVRIRSDNIPGTIGFIRMTLKDLLPHYTFEYEFLDTRIENLYRTEQRMEKILTFSTIIAIFISCLGLLGLASFTAEQRTKEIGIRKVLGSTVAGVVFLLSKEFIKWVLLANLIAWPLAYLAVHSWLENFAIRTRIEWEIFLLAGILALVISLLTVCYQSIKAALANPIDSLRYE